ncbi:ABC transporter [Kocuria polaris]|nr:ABC transporter [Kocuria polaris]
MPPSARSPILDPAIAPALRPAVPAMAAGVVTAASSGIAMVGGAWCVVGLIGDPSLVWAGWACVLWLAGAMLLAFSSWLSHYAEARFEARLRRQVAGHLARLPSRRLNAYRGDELRRLVSDDIAALHHLVAHLPGEIATMVVVPAATVCLLVAAAGAVALIALLPGLLAAVFSLVVVPRMAARHVEEQEDVAGAITTAVDDYTRGVRVNRIYGSDVGAALGYRTATERFVTGMVTRVGVVATPAAIGTALLQAAVTFAVAYAVGFRWEAQTLAAILLFSLAIVTPALRLGHGLDYVGAGQAAMRRLSDALREPVLPAGTRVPPAAGAAFVADSVAVEAEGRAVLGPVSHVFRPGVMTAITGPSGAGKSTLLRVLAGLERADLGDVRFGEISVSEMAEDARRRAVLLIPQGGDVLPAPIRDTVLLGADDVAVRDDTRGEDADAPVRQALDRAQLSADPGADAETLSGGERQRVSLARAFLSSAPVLLLDEPTSALDGVTAAGLTKELRRLAHEDGRTVILVTHDMALAAEADDRLVLRPTCETSIGSAAGVVR